MLTPMYRQVEKIQRCIKSIKWTSRQYLHWSHKTLNKTPFVDTKYAPRKYFSINLIGVSIGYQKSFILLVHLKLVKIENFLIEK